MLRKPRQTFALYGLAYLGIHLGFMPLLVLLLPRRVAAIAPESAPVILSWLLLVGGLTAAFSHILAGALSDRALASRGSRRLPIAAGLWALLASYILLALADDVPRLFLALIAFQIALNLTFAPLGALLADYFPDHKKGLMAGLMNGALPVSSASVGIIAALFLKDSASGFIVTGLISAACILPLIIWWPFGGMTAGAVAQPVAAPGTEAPSQIPARISRDFVFAWIARLLIQLGAAFLIGYVYLYLADLTRNSGAPDGQTASEWLATIALPAGVLALIATLGAGWLSDRMGVRRWPMIVSAGAIAASLIAISLGESLGSFLLAYAVFQAGLAIFLSVETAMVAQLVSVHERRGALLGVMNLTNTLPAIIAPALTLMALGEQTIAPVLSTIFLVCAGAAGVAALTVSRISVVR